MTDSGAKPSFWKSLTSPVINNEENRVHINYLKTRDIRPSRSVFHHGGKVCKKHGLINDAAGSRKPPSWLELSGDLAWSAAFGSLTNNRTISGPADITNYAVFFALMWLLWGSQTAYDIKYYTNDWLHRIVFVCQLLTYGTLSSFTADFDVFWRLRNISGEVFTGNVSSLTAASMFTRAERNKELSLEGVSIVIFANRILLCCQYIIIECRRSYCEVPLSDCAWCGKLRSTRCWHYFAVPVSVAASAFMFLAAHLILRFGPLTRATSIIQFCLWTAAILTEVAGYAFSYHGDEHEDHAGRIAERLSNLTVIVTGEGLNSIFGVTKHTVNAVGVGPKMLAILGSLGVTLYGIWFCYFESYHSRLPESLVIREAWFLLHFPFHLCLILVLEGLKSMIQQSNLVISTEHIRNAFQVGGINTSSRIAKVVHILEKLGMSWSQFQVDSSEAATKGEVAQRVWYHRFVLAVIYKQFEKYQDIDDETKYYFDEYTKVNEYVLTDLAEAEVTGNWGPTFRAIVSQLEKPLYDATTFLVPTGGATICFIAILNLIQKKPTDRYGWGSFFTKIIGGCVLIILVTVHIGMNRGHNLGATVWRIPTLAITLTTIVFVDILLLKLAVKPLGKPIGKYDIVANPSEQKAGQDVAPNASQTKIISESQIEVATPEKSKELLV